MGRLLNPPGYAKHVGVDPMRIYQLLKSGVIKSRLISGKKHIDLSIYSKHWFTKVRKDGRKK